MDIQNTRFGTIVYDESRALTLPAGMIGFSRETRFIFLEPPAGRRVAWLQSLISPELAFPVVGAALFGDAYPSPGLYELGRRARLVRSPEDELTALVVVAAPRGSGRIRQPLGAHRHQPGHSHGGAGRAGRRRLLRRRAVRPRLPPAGAARVRAQPGRRGPAGRDLMDSRATRPRWAEAPRATRAPRARGSPPIR